MYTKNSIHRACYSGTKELGQGLNVSPEDGGSVIRTVTITPHFYKGLFYF